MPPRPTYILMLGPSGSGKGTVAKALSERFNLPHCSTGDMLRELAKLNSSQAAMAREILEKGKFATARPMYALVAKALKRHPDGLILDGFPRKVIQGHWLFTKRLPAHATIIALLVDAPDAVVTDRMLNHRRRADDTPEKIAKRLAEYAKYKQPLLDYLEARQWLLRVNGNQAPERVIQDAIHIVFEALY